MDKNTITGLLLIVAIMFGFSYFNKPSEEELALAKAKAKQEQLELLKQEQESAQGSEKRDDYSLLDSSVELNDSLRAIEMKGRFGSFSNLISGEREFVTLENNLMKVTLLNRGGRVYSVELKNYKRHDGSPLILFDGDANKFGANFFVNNRSIDTDKLYLEE